MWMFQPKIYLDNLWTILPDKMTNILETMKKFAEIKNPIIVLFIKWSIILWNHAGLQQQKQWNPSFFFLEKAT